jgi:tetratricopeptide (TPR) repeat protein
LRLHNETRQSEAGQSREKVLFTSLVLLVVMFATTSFVSSAFHSTESGLARRWAARGDASLRDGRVESALEEYRSALVYDPGNFQNQFHLAQALAKSGHGDQASGYLLTLLGEAPNNGEVNLELARLARVDGRNDEAINYYHAAIYGVWSNDTLEVHRQARVELTEYLLSINQKQAALAEIMELTTRVSDEDAANLVLIGNLLLRAGSPDHALHEFTLALKDEPQSPGALFGAGQAEFQLGANSEAVDYLSKARRLGGNDAAIEQTLEKARTILEIDPYVPGLTESERARRTARAFEEALSSLEDCAQKSGIPLSSEAPSSDLASAYAAADSKRVEWSEKRLQHDPEMIDAAMGMVFRMESLVASKCGAPRGGANLGLLLLAQRRGSQNQ